MQSIVPDLNRRLGVGSAASICPGWTNDACERVVGVVRFELTSACSQNKCLKSARLHSEKGGTGRTRTVIVLLDKQVPHLSVTVPCQVFGERERVAREI